MLSEHADALALAYGLGAVVEPMTLAGRGEQGRVWRLSTTDGVVAVKELLVRQRRSDAELDVAHQEAVLADGRVLMPRPLRTPAGAVLLEIGGHQVRAASWVDVGAPDPTLDPVLVGRTVAAVHRVDHRPARPVDGWFVDPVGERAWHGLVRQARAAGAPFADAFASEVPHLLALEGLLERPTTLQSCHRDLWSDNLLATPDGRLCVLEWESSGLADPSQELPVLLVEFGGRDPARVAALYGAYRDAGGPGRIRGPGACTMVIAQFGHFWATAVREHLDPRTDSAGRAHALGRIAELLDPPFRREHVDELLDQLAPLG